MKNGVLLVLVIALAVVPLAMHRPAPAPSAAPAGQESAAPAGEGEKQEVFGGADDQASALIEKLRPGYKPWAKPLFEPPSGEIESLLFALQAALGAGVLFYYLGYAKGRSVEAEGAAKASLSSAAEPAGH
jgi:cobalt/nickel transport protein